MTVAAPSGGASDLPVPDADVLARIDTTVAHPARRYNYWLGGKDNFAADRASGDRIAQRFPAVPAAARANRAFAGRAVRYLARRGVRQFLDIGTGLPAPCNTHEVAQRVARVCRVVYVDNDPIVLAHARALLTGATPDTVAYLDADLRDPDSILRDPVLHQTLDLTRPIAVLLIAVLHFIAHPDPRGIVARLRRALVPGSFVVISHGTADFLDEQDRAALPGLTARDAAGFYPRSRDELRTLLDGLDLVKPGLVSVRDWRNPDDPGPCSAEEIGVYGAVGRIP
ncbi:SAM-dependent methyltransferase [Dactylosporangium sp. McL0621]|uniref:SAM-dependent methyltransferase n=1 Tax=Dactylosporangium sp. McL0621 TaxID=3415678 RepID=UPI003CF4A77B